MKTREHPVCQKCDATILEGGIVVEGDVRRSCGEVVSKGGKRAYCRTCFDRLMGWPPEVITTPYQLWSIPTQPIPFDPAPYGPLIPQRDTVPLPWRQPLTGGPSWTSGPTASGPAVAGSTLSVV